jgi:hypothetical protein
MNFFWLILQTNTLKIFSANSANTQKELRRLRKKFSHSATFDSFKGTVFRKNPMGHYILHGLGRTSYNIYFWLSKKHLLSAVLSSVAGCYNEMSSILAD